MEETQHGFALHAAIEDNDYPRLENLLRMSKLGINLPNTHGDTPLLKCLQLERPREFIMRLLLEGASVIIANEDGFTPLSFASYFNSDILRMLLENSVDKQFLYKKTMRRDFYEAIENGKIDFGIRFCVINKDSDSENLILSINPLLVSNHVYVPFREFNTFLQLLGDGKNSSKPISTPIWRNLIVESMHLTKAATFKILWKRFPSTNTDYLQSILLSEIVECCKFENSEFIECVRLILTSSYSGYFVFKPRSKFLFYNMFSSFSSRNIEKHDRLFIISFTLKLLKHARIDDIANGYYIFGFNEEVVMLLQHLKPIKNLSRKNYLKIRKFIMALETDPRLSIDNLKTLNLMLRTSYRNLLKRIPGEVFNNNKTIKRKKLLLNKLPTLFERSQYSLQKCLQKYYSIQDLNQLSQVVENLALPKTLKTSLCSDPPVYYNL